MAERVYTAVFKIESEAYQALSELKTSAITNDYVISQTALVEKKDGLLRMKDAFDTGVDTRNDAAKGGLIGALVGILGGPLGMLIGGSWGYLIGSVVDAGDATENASIIERVSGQIMDGEVALISLVQENVPGSIEGKLSKYDVNVSFEDAAEVADEVERAQKVQKDLAKEAKKKVREEKLNSTKEKVEEQRQKIVEQFKKLTNK